MKSETFVIIGSGPSLRKSQLDLISESFVTTIAVNNNYSVYPECDILFACDLKWWRVHYEDVLLHVKPNCEFHTIEGIVRPLRKTIEEIPKDLKEWPFKYDGEGLGLEKLMHGGNSGYLAINAAFLLGAKKIILVGFDHKYDETGKRHWFGDHDPKFFNQNADNVDRWLKKFEKLAQDLEDNDIDLVNCSLDTAIESCRKSTLEIELPLD